DNICVATGGKSICSGDSGGPLVTLDTYEQIGINSFVSGGGCEGDAPAVLVRVTNFLDWIKENTGLNV
uniref:Peptidase S1 domain-containing protein n=1 Tax=Megaselia scalaris TaxID=36166 RepID=T1GHG0_MEGSC